jgi:hypothetical protein
MAKVEWSTTPLRETSGESPTVLARTYDIRCAYGHSIVADYTNAEKLAELQSEIAFQKRAVELRSSFATS